jgi:hypothetical protein
VPGWSVLPARRGRSACDAASVAAGGPSRDELLVPPRIAVPPPPAPLPFSA